jgi:outer membrane lipoprotein SlyB
MSRYLLRAEINLGQTRENDMTTLKARWPLVLVIVGAIAAYVHAHPPAPPKPVTVTVAQGTPVELRLGHAVSSKTSSAGERFSGKLAKPILLNGQVIVPEGTEFSGTVLQAVPVGRLAGGASLRVSLNTFSLEGQEYSIQTAPVVRISKGQGKRTAEFAGGGAALGAAIGALVHGGKGALIGAAAGAGAGAVGSAATPTAHDVVLPAESVVAFHLTQDVVVTQKPAPETQHADVVARIRSLFS